MWRNKKLMAIQKKSRNTILYLDSIRGTQLYCYELKRIWAPEMISYDFMNVCTMKYDSINWVKEIFIHSFPLLIILADILSIPNLYSIF